MMNMHIFIPNLPLKVRGIKGVMNKRNRSNNTSFFESGVGAFLLDSFDGFGGKSKSERFI